MPKQVEIFLIVFLFIFMSAIVLIIHTKQREQDFKTQNFYTQKATVKGSAYAINQLLISKQRHVRLFSYEFVNLLSHLKLYPLDFQTEEELKTRLSQRFPDYFTYTITDQNAVPRLFDIDAFVGDACKKDLTNFVKRILHKTDKTIVKNKVFIHPQSEHYHYDVMSPLLNKDGSTDIFFISFYLDGIVKILKSYEIPGNQLLLLKQSDSNLIEATSDGTRDKLSREIRLRADEQLRIQVYQDIPDTDWRIANLPSLHFEKNHNIALWKQAGLILLIEILLILTLLYFFTKRRKSNL